MTQLSIRQVAALLAVSDDTVRRLIEAGTLPAAADGSGRKTVRGEDMAAYLRERADTPTDGGRSSARNRFAGLVTDVRTDEVMAQVELQCGPFRVVSLMSTEAVRDLGLQVGSLATAVVKSTTVIVETP